jgi:predicted nucleic acid-binding protein
MHRVCVIDNSTLVTLTKLRHLSIFSLLRNLFAKIHIPLKIKEEYENERSLEIEPERKILLRQMKLNEGFLSICNQYETVSLMMFKTTKGIDLGEAEAAAQHLKISSHFVISDDKTFVSGLKKADPSIKVIGTLELIAWLDVLKLLPDVRGFLEVVHSYKFAHSYLSIPLEKKTLSKKASLKHLKLKL